MKLRNLIWVLGLMLSMHALAESWYPSKWGKDDTLGALNEITPEHIVNAAKLVKTGKRYALGMETSRDTPAFGARTAQIFMVSHAALFGNAGEPYGTGKATGNDDWALLFFGVGSQIDGLGHVGIDHVYYNGNKVQDFFSQSGTKKLSTSDIPPIVTRGVVLDIVAYLKETQPERIMTVDGNEMLKPDVAVNEAELKGALERQHIELGKGEVIIVHTGFMALMNSDPKRYMAAQPGLGLNGALFLASYDPVAVGADTFGVEVTPGEVKGLELSVHMALLPKRGIYILENMVTRELVADEAWEFMFVLGQARIKGTVQMIINPVAIR
ncbi:MAG: cyclase family protein [Proteobacteria bacterium]|nr:cyclase family protein [Pseudomonadota bacterium]